MHVNGCICVKRPKRSWAVPPHPRWSLISHDCPVHEVNSVEKQRFLYSLTMHEHLVNVDVWSWCSNRELLAVFPYAKEKHADIWGSWSHVLLSLLPLWLHKNAIWDRHDNDSKWNLNWYKKDYSLQSNFRSLTV